jgi:hypothetical protein
MPPSVCENIRLTTSPRQTWIQVQGLSLDSLTLQSVKLLVLCRVESCLLFVIKSSLIIAAVRLAQPLEHSEPQRPPPLHYHVSEEIVELKPGVDQCCLPHGSQDFPTLLGWEGHDVVHPRCPEEERGSMRGHNAILQLVNGTHQLLRVGIAMEGS